MAFTMTTIHPELAVARLAAREIRNGLIALVVAAVLMLAAVLGSFSATDIATSESFAKLLENPAVRALYGMPFDTTNAGGFAVWRFGTILCVLAGLWALMATTRVLRGEEEAGRWDLLLTAPVTRDGVLLSHVKALGAGSVVVGLAVFGSFVAGGEPAGPPVARGGLVDVPEVAVDGEREQRQAAVGAGRQHRRAEQVRHQDLALPRQRVPDRGGRAIIRPTAGDRRRPVARWRARFALHR